MVEYPHFSDFAEESKSFEGGELPPDKSGWLPPTIPKDLVAQHMSEQERNVVGSALKGPVYQGQPVNHKNNVDTDIDFAVQGGTIHPPDKSGGILYPSTPRYKKKLDDILNQEILVLDFKIKDSKQHIGSKYITIQFKIDEKSFIVFSGSAVLMNQLEKYKDSLPFYTTIKKIDKYYTFT